MIRLLVFLACLVPVAAGAAWLADQPSVVVDWQGYRLETTLLVLAGGVLACFLVLACVWMLLRTLLRLPAFLRLRSRTQRRERGVLAASRGLVAVGSGDTIAARRYATQAERLLGRAPLALLLKAQAAQLHADKAGAQAAFRAMLEEPETHILGLRGLFVEARRQGDLVAARSTAFEAARLAPSVLWSRDATLEFYCADRDWVQARKTLDRSISAKTLEKPQGKRLRAVLLTAEALDRAEREPDAALALGREALKLNAGCVPAAVLVGRLYASRGELRKAARVFEACWTIEPHPDLMHASLGLRKGESALERLRRAKVLAKAHPQHPEVRFAVARAATEAREFALARETLAPLLEGRPSVRVCLLMADIEEAEHGATGAVREWLSRAARAPRDPAWIADGVVSERWMPVSPVTGRLDAFVWGPPDEQTSLQNVSSRERAEQPAAALLLPEQETPEPEATLSVETEAQKKAEIVPVLNSAAIRNTAPHRSTVSPQPIIFPIAHAPDDPGPKDFDPDKVEGASPPSRFYTST